MCVCVRVVCVGEREYVFVYFYGGLGEKLFEWKWYFVIMCNDIFLLL